METPEGEGTPDGMTVDSRGYVWSARRYGSSLFRYAPDGTAVGQVRFPAKKVSNVKFGGSDLTDMYVTTAGGGNRAENGPGADGMFEAHPGVRGKPECLSPVRLD